MSGFYEIPGRRRFNHPGWSDVTVFVMDCGDADELESTLNRLIASDDEHVLAFSAGRHSQDTHGDDVWTSTIVLQGRIDPNGGETTS